MKIYQKYTLVFLNTIFILFWFNNLKAQNIRSDSYDYSVFMDDSLNSYLLGVADGKGYLSKQDSSGKFFWSIISGKSEDEVAVKVYEKKNENNWLFTSTIYSPLGVGSRDILFQEIDNYGTVKYSNIYGTDFFDDVRAVFYDSLLQVTYISFTTSKYSQTVNDIVLLAIDSLGDILWSRVLLSDGEDIVNNILKSDSSIYLVGNSTLLDDKNALIIKLNTEGEILWSRHYGGVEADEFTSICELDDEIYVTGWTESFGFGEKDILIVSLDSEGNWMWCKTVGDWLIERGNLIKIFNDTLYVTGYMQSTSGSLDDMLVIKLDKSGNEVLCFQIDAEGNQYGTEIKVTSDKYYILGPELVSSWGGKIYEISNNDISCDTMYSSLASESINISTFFGFYRDSIVTSSIFKIEYTCDSITRDSALINLSSCFFDKEIQDTIVNSTEISSAIINKLLIYPNPGSDISINIDIGFCTKYDIINQLGQVVYKGVFQKGFNKIKPALIEGVYLIRVDNSISKLFIVK